MRFLGTQSSSINEIGSSVHSKNSRTTEIDSLQAKSTELSDWKSECGWHESPGSLWDWDAYYDDQSLDDNLKVKIDPMRTKPRILHELFRRLPPFPNSGDESSDGGSTCGSQDPLHEDSGIDKKLTASALQVSKHDIKAFRRIPEDLGMLSVEVKRQMLTEIDAHLKTIAPAENGGDDLAKQGPHNQTLNLTHYILVEHQKPCAQSWEPTVKS